MRRERAAGIDAPMTARTVVACDLDLEDSRLRLRKLGDGPSSEPERLVEVRATVGAALPCEAERRGVRHGTFSGATGVTRLASCRERIPMDRTPLEDATRRDVADLSGPIRGGEHRGSGLVAAELSRSLRIFSRSSRSSCSRRSDRSSCSRIRRRSGG